MEKEDIHFEVEDFKGRKIICTNSRWNDHIIIDPDHPYMEGSEQEVIDALQNPDPRFRSIDKDYPNGRIYYKLSRTGDYFTKVVVEYNNDKCTGIGRVWTAYQPDEIKPGEMPEFENE
jgi:hypothetical protein